MILQWFIVIAKLSRDSFTKKCKDFSGLPIAKQIKFDTCYNFWLQYKMPTKIFVTHFDPLAKLGVFDFKSQNTTTTIRQ